MYHTEQAASRERAAQLIQKIWRISCRTTMNRDNKDQGAQKQLLSLEINGPACDIGSEGNEGPASTRGSGCLKVHWWRKLGLTPTRRTEISGRGRRGGK